MALATSLTQATVEPTEDEVNNLVTVLSQLLDSCVVVEAGEIRRLEPSFGVCASLNLPAKFQVCFFRWGKEPHEAGRQCGCESACVQYLSAGDRNIAYKIQVYQADASGKYWDWINPAPGELYNYLCCGGALPNAILRACANKLS